MTSAEARSDDTAAELHDDALSTFTMESRVDKTPVFVRRWNPPCGIDTRAVVQITHGMAEHSGRYNRLARFLAAQGYVVYGPDLRGHGQTAGAAGLGRAGVTAWQDMCDDIAHLCEVVRAAHPGLPLVAFGHSMGSALTQWLIQHHGDALAGAILCGTMGSVPGLTDDAYRAAVNKLSAAATGPEADTPSGYFGAIVTAFNAPFIGGIAHPTGSEWQTSDPEELRRFTADPLCGHPFSNAMAYSVITGMHGLWLPQNEALVPADLPILVIAGTEDPVGANTVAVRELITRYLHRGHRALAYRFYAGARHEILNEPVKAVVHRDIGLFIARTIGS